MSFYQKTRCLQYLWYSLPSTKSLIPSPAVPLASSAVYRFLRSSVMAAKIMMRIKKNLKLILMSIQANLQNLWDTPSMPGAKGGVK